ncbi:MAG TPA: TonB-dependent receptor, partial [Nannocystis exedens]|nr:TonB-dependent receptor [Nannocystis exedens]
MYRRRAGPESERWAVCTRGTIASLFVLSFLGPASLRAALLTEAAASLEDSADSEAAKARHRRTPRKGRRDREEKMEKKEKKEEKEKKEKKKRAKRRRENLSDGGDQDRDNVEQRTIVVTASRTEESLSDTSVVTEVVTREQIEASGAENAAEILEEQPGIQITPGARGGAGGLGIRLLGLDPQHTLILIDGLRATGRLNGVIDLTRFSSEGLRQVEVVKGPASVLYGSDAMGGVVNLITRDIDRPLVAEAHAVYGSRRTVDASGLVGIMRRR